MIQEIKPHEWVDVQSAIIAMVKWVPYCSSGFGTLHVCYNAATSREIAIEDIPWDMFVQFAASGDKAKKIMRSIGERTIGYK